MSFAEGLEYAESATSGQGNPMKDDYSEILTTSKKPKKVGIERRQKLHRRSIVWLLGVSAFMTGLRASASVDPPATLLRVWGTGVRGVSPFLPVLRMLEDRYRLHHPQVRFEHRLNGDDSALGGLYSGAADLIFMERDPSYIELDGYQQVLTREKPAMRQALLGGVGPGGQSSPLVVIVNRNNPLSALTLDQVNSIFNAEHEAAGEAKRCSIQSWSELGLQGLWRKRSLHPYGFDPQSPESQTLAVVAMHGVVRWPCSYVGEGSSTGGDKAAASVALKVASDRYGVGITTLNAVTPAVRVVPIEDANGIQETPREASLLNGRYSLQRGVTVLFRDGSGPVNEEARQFVEYLGSDEAAAVIRAEGSYLPARAATRSTGAGR